MSDTPALSIVVIAYEMSRELPRTIRSLSPEHQLDVSAEDYELVVVDNGSKQPVSLERLAAWGAHVRTASPARPSPSPAGAINAGLAAARADYIGVMIDGARMASPGLVWSALLARHLHPRPVVGTLGFHLGPDVQMRTVRAGYDAATEDRLLEAVGWPDDGYGLFRIAALAASSARGWFGPLSESNALFLNRAEWELLGGAEERFSSPGGGFVNLDLWRRACGVAKPIMLLGEATFHQVHGGVATNATTSRSAEYHDEYERIRGERFRPPEIDPIHVGRIRPEVLPWIERSAHSARGGTH